MQYQHTVLFLLVCPNGAILAYIILIKGLVICNFILMIMVRNARASLWPSVHRSRTTTWWRACSAHAAVPWNPSTCGAARTWASAGWPSWSRAAGCWRSWTWDGAPRFRAAPAASSSWLAACHAYVNSSSPPTAPCATLIWKSWLLTAMRWSISIYWVRWNIRNEFLTNVLVVGQSKKFEAFACIKHSVHSLQT